MPNSMDPYMFGGGADPRGPMPPMGQQTSSRSFPPQMMDRNHPSMQGQYHPHSYQQQRPPVPAPYAQFNRGPPPPQRFDARKSLPHQQQHQPIRGQQHPPPFADPPPPIPMRPTEQQQQFNMRGGEMSYRPDMMMMMPPSAQQQQHAEALYRAEGEQARDKMRAAEMQARESMSPLNYCQQMPPHHGGLTQLSPSQQQSFAAASSIPLRESLVHNIRHPGAPMPTMEEMRALEVAHAKMALAVAQTAANASGGRQKSPTKQANIQDAASALLNMGSIIKQSEDSSDEKTESVNGDEAKGPPGSKPFPTRLACPEDEEKLNSMHCFLRAELLEVFLIENAPAPPPKPAPGEENTLKALEAELMHQPPPNAVPNRIGIRCVHCSRAKKIYGQECEAPMAVFYPKSLAELYRLVTSWQRVHLRKCRNLPKGMRETYQTLRATDKTRGKTHYWVTSAKKLGLKDSKRPSGGIVWDP